jgi:hypothetical protein
MADTFEEKREPSTSDHGVLPVLEKSITGDGEVAPAVAPPKPAFTVPDGGLEAWGVVLGGWLILFATFGYVNGASPRISSRSNG